jgi:hypothetical protein
MAAIAPGKPINSHQARESLGMSPSVVTASPSHSHPATRNT